MYRKFLVIFLFIFAISHFVFAQSALRHTFSEVEMAVTDFGALAGISGGSLSYNFRYPASEEDSFSYLHPYSEIWVGDLEGNVATAFDISEEEFVFGEFQVTQDGVLEYASDSPSRQKIVTQYATIPETDLPFEILIDQISYSWKKSDYPEASDFIVMELVITNTNSFDLNDFFVAVSTNWDIDDFNGVDNPNLDWADWDEARQAGFMYDADDSDELDSIHTALVLLDGRFHAYRIIPFLVEDDINSNPYIDSSRSDILSSSVVDRKDELLSPGNYMNIIVAGAYDIPRKKAIKISFAFVAGESLLELQRNIEEAYRITYVPEQFTVEPKDSTVELKWSKPINHSVAGYYIMRRTEQSEYEQVNSSIVSGLFYEDKGLENGEKYYYKVVSVNMYGEKFVINSKIMESVEKSAIPNPVPSPPQLDATVTDKKIELTWTKATERNISHYILFRNHSGEPPWAKIATVDSSVNSFVDENVYPEVNYYYTIASVSSSDVRSDLAESVLAKLEKEDISLPKENLERVFVSPNPCNISLNNTLLFRNLTERAKIRIYTVSGELVKMIHHRNGKPTEQWDCRNEHGNFVSPGTYFYHITAWTSGKDGELTTNGKFSILR